MSVVYLPAELKLGKDEPIGSTYTSYFQSATIELKIDGLPKPQIVFTDDLVHVGHKIFIRCESIGYTKGRTVYRINSSIFEDTHCVSLSVDDINHLSLVTLDKASKSEAYIGKVLNVKQVNRDSYRVSLQSGSREFTGIFTHAKDVIYLDNVSYLKMRASLKLDGTTVYTYTSQSEKQDRVRGTFGVALVDASNVILI